MNIEKCQMLRTYLRTSSTTSTFTLLHGYKKGLDGYFYSDANFLDKLCNIVIKLCNNVLIILLNLTIVYQYIYSNLLFFLSEY